MAEVADAGPPTTAPSTDPPTAVRTALSLRGSELYIPPWFAAKNGRYDLIVHFHGEGRWQEANVEHAHLNVVVVSFNSGKLGDEPYANAFKDPATFDQLLADVDAQMGGAKLNRLALSAWSAGFASIARLMGEPIAERVDAVLLADGFFTSFSDLKKRTVNEKGIERFAQLAAAARKNEKLFAITHTTIPTGPYPSTQECVVKLLQMENMATSRKGCSIDGPRPKMHQFYKVDDGSFHIAGFEGTRAADHVRQLHAMGETTYPYLKARWEKQDAALNSSDAAR